MNLNTYLTTHAQALAEAAMRVAPPLHNDLVDPVHPGIAGLGIKTIGKQGHAITALVKSFCLQDEAILFGSCGTGKTLMAAAVAHLCASGQPYRGLVMTPSHIAPKWVREVKAVLPGAKARVIESWRDTISLKDLPDPTGPEWFIVGRDKAKLGCFYEPALMQRGDLPAVCPTCGAVPVDSKGETLEHEQIKATHAKCRGCGETLVQPARQPRRWAPAQIIKKLLPKNWFDFYIPDESHELAGLDRDQALAFGALVSCCRRTIPLTGTLSNGKAESLGPTLFRLRPSEMKAAGFSWDRLGKFAEKYGRTETTVKIRTTADGKVTRRTTKKCVPGIMPSLFADFLVGNSVFVSLDDVAEGLPPLHEELIGVEMDQFQRQDYERIEADFRKVIGPMLAAGDKRLLSTMLQTMLAWPDMPFGCWEKITHAKLVKLADGSSVSVEVPVCSPPNYSPNLVLPKERRLIEIVKGERSRGRQVWVYVQHTGTYDVAGRLQQMLEHAGFEAGLLRSDDVEPEDREQWIAEHGPGLDVGICHAKLVQTGVDLFDKQDRTYNFPTLVFYETGYNVNELRQAAARASRLKQWMDCRTLYLFYERSMQERALSLMGRKVVASESIEGKFSTEGLCSLAADDSMELELARSFADNMVENAGEAWAGVAEPEWKELQALLAMFGK